MSSIFDSPAFTDRLFFPHRSRTRPHSSIDDVTVDVPGASLRLRRHQAPRAAAHVLLFYGNGETADDYDGLGPRFADAGLALTVCDYRGYGGSTGAPTLRLALSDARAIWAARPDDGRPWWVMGRSLGSTCALEVAAHERIAGLILESAIGDLFGLVARRQLGGAPSFTPADLATFEPQRKLARVPQPVLILHGDDDDIIDVSEAVALHAAVTHPRVQLARLPDVGHNDIGQSPGYWPAISAFVAAHPSPI